MKENGFRNPNPDIPSATKEITDLIYKEDKTDGTEAQNEVELNGPTDFIAVADTNPKSDGTAKFPNNSKRGPMDKNVGTKPRPQNQNKFKKGRNGRTYGDRVGNGKKKLNGKDDNLKSNIKCHICRGPHLLKKCPQVLKLMTQNSEKRESASAVNEQPMEVQESAGDDNSKEKRITMGDVSVFFISY